MAMSNWKVETLNSPTAGEGFEPAKKASVDIRADAITYSYLQTQRKSLTN